MNEFKLVDGNTYFRYEVDADDRWRRLEPKSLYGLTPSAAQAVLFEFVSWVERRERAFRDTAQPPEHANEYELRGWTPAVGDTVILRGQPERVLTVVCPDSRTEDVRCEWFDATGNVVSRSFPRLALVLVSANPRRESP